MRTHVKKRKGYGQPGHLGINVPFPVAVASEVDKESVEMYVIFRFMYYSYLKEGSCFVDYIACTVKNIRYNNKKERRNKNSVSVTHRWKIIQCNNTFKQCFSIF